MFWSLNFFEGLGLGLDQDQDQDRCFETKTMTKTMGLETKALGFETKTLGFETKTKTGKIGLETVSRPRPRSRDHNSDIYRTSYTVIPLIKLGKSHIYNLKTLY